MKVDHEDTNSFWYTYKLNVEWGLSPPVTNGISHNDFFTMFDKGKYLSKNKNLAKEFACLLRLTYSEKVKVWGALIQWIVMAF